LQFHVISPRANAQKRDRAADEASRATTSGLPTAKQPVLFPALLQYLRARLSCLVQRNGHRLFLRFALFHFGFDVFGCASWDLPLLSGM
jgi:hypothetical protein